MNESTNRCPHCGGQLVVEYIGSYGDDNKMIYCWNCRKMPEDTAEEDNDKS